MYIKKELTENGYTAYTNTEQSPLQMDVGILKLSAGREWDILEPEKEISITLLSGDAEITFADVKMEISRSDCFSEEAWCFLLPRETHIHIKVHQDAEFYLQAAYNERTYRPFIIRPEDVQIQDAGAAGELNGCMRRRIKTFFDYENAPFSNMVLGEILNYAGMWSSYPPHYHPQPEIYFYRFEKEQGFGVGFANGDVFKTEHNSALVIGSDFHSQAAAPGYEMCYLWGIRHLPGDPWEKTRIDCEEHKWLLGK